jgi:UDP-glucose 4-epimerase
MGRQRVAVITGGAGFIGSHLAERLVATDWHVRVIDNETTGSRKNLPLGVEYRYGDIRNPEVVGSVLNGPVDAVFHLAAQVSSMRAYLDPVDDATTNLVGTLNVLTQCLQHQIPRFLHASSMALYGRTDSNAIGESCPCDPVSYYGTSKLAAENCVFATANRRDLQSPFYVTAFRMFNVYGPGQSLSNTYQGVFGVFIGKILRGEPVVIFGTGEQSRDFIYVDDVIDAWCAAIDNPQSYGRAINLGTGTSLAINQALNTILVSLGHSRDKYPVIQEPELSGDQHNIRADIQMARSILGWQPRISFIEGLARTIAWAKLQFEVDAASPKTPGLLLRR